MWMNNRLSQADLFNEFGGFEVASQVEDLPGGQAQQAAHAENAEVQHPTVGRFCKHKLPHLINVPT